jgi:UDP-N-acetyl-D-mannosaminuronic acid dehydrogenase
MMKKVCVIGLGYIGLPTAALLANKGYQVIGVDINEKAVEIINQGKIHIVEPDLDVFVQSAVKSGKLKAYLEPQEADVFIICVPTPFYNETEIPTPNLDYVLSAANAISPYVKKDDIVILESTSPVGATQKVAETLSKNGVDTSEINLAYCPERVLPGKIMFELTENDRIVGGIDEKSTKVVEEFYNTFVNGEVITTDAKTAEMSKLVENSYRDVNIAFANELSILSDDLGINVWELIDIANHHPRVNILQPGSGVGGHCIAVDPWFIVSQNPQDAKIIKTAREVNNYKTQWCIEKVKSEALKFELDNKRKPKVAFMGLAFKPDIDDLRESPALFIATSLQSEVDNVVVEPNITEFGEATLVEYSDALEMADIVIFLVSHKEFKSLDVSEKIVVDFCGVTN